jgi:drug/metabolite transporter (DMT)-like permease
VRIVGLGCALLAALAYGIGSVAQSAGVRDGTTDPAAQTTGVQRLARSPLFVLGLAFDALGFAASLVALRALPLFAVQSVLATSLAVTVLLARLLLHARLRRVDLAAVAVAAVACAVTASAAGAQPAAAPSHPFVVSLIAGAAAAVVAGLVLARSRAAPWLLAVVSGLAQSVQVLSARGLSLTGLSARHPLHAAAVVVAEPLAWTLAVAGVTGVVLYGLALERGGVAAATAILWVVEIVVPTVCGLAFLGDLVRTGWPVPLAGALAAAIAAAVVLARSPAQV